MIHKSHTILYVDDQEKSTTFYTAILNIQPRLHVPGMTEFELAPDAILGLMPGTDILELLGDTLPPAGIANGLMCAELYLMVDDPAAYHRRALENGARNMSDLAPRSWGHLASYCLDLDGYVLAFAADLGSTP